MGNSFFSFLLKITLLAILVLSIVQIKLKFGIMPPPPPGEEKVDSTRKTGRILEIADSLFAGDTKFAKELVPDSLFAKGLSWKSEKPEIASVEKESGKIVSLLPGNCEIYGINNKDTIVKMHVSVSPSKQKSDIKLTSIEMKLKPEQQTLNPSEELTIPVTFLPKNASDTTLVWESSNQDIATVDSNGKISAKRKNGSTTITVKAKDGSGVKSSVEITVTTTPILPKIEIEKTKTVIATGNTIPLKLKTVPKHAEIIWKSSNPGIATVDSKTGLLTSKAEGKVKVSVTVKTLNGEKSTDSFEVTIKDKSSKNTYKLKYGTWHGQLNKSGLPHGEGYIVFSTTTHVADTNGGEPIYAARGMKCPAYFKNGELISVTVNKEGIWNNLKI